MMFCCVVLEACGVGGLFVNEADKSEEKIVLTPMNSE